MKQNGKKFLVMLSTLALTLVGIGAVSAPASAADCKYPVTDPTSNDKPKFNVRLVSPVLNDSNSIRRYDFEGEFTLDCDWFGVGMRFNQVYVPFGQNATLTFNVTNASGVPQANTKVTLRANKGYSNSNANVRVNGIKARPAPSNASDGANVNAYTDVNGNVSFMVMSPDDCEAYGGVLPAAPTRLDADTPNDRNRDPMTDCYSQMLPQVSGEKTDSADFVELHYFNPSGLDYSLNQAQISLLAPTLDEMNSIAGDGVVQMYAPVSSKQFIAFQATKPDGSWARNVPVRVRINLADSGSNARVSAGIVGNTANGMTTVPSTADSTKTAQDQLVLTGNTDAFGVVTFQLNNIDSVGITPPASKTTPVPVTGSRFAKIFAEVIDKTNTGSALEIHYFKPAPPTAITITASGRKITVVITNAVGKPASVSITGRAKATLTPNVARKVVSYTVTKGVRKVTVTANGKTVTKTFTIK